MTRLEGGGGGRGGEVKARSDEEVTRKRTRKLLLSALTHSPAIRLLRLSSIKASANNTTLCQENLAITSPRIERAQRSAV